MALFPGSSTPQNQGLPYPPSESRLELMPTELLDQIFGHHSQKHLQSFYDLQDDDLLEANRSAHSNMRSLCLTSKRLDSVARPLLFQNITITSTAKLFLLRETLQGTAQIGYHVKQLSLDIMLKTTELWDSLTPPFSRSVDLLIQGFKNVPKKTKAVFSNAYFAHTLSSSYFEILGRTPRVRNLVLRMQPIDSETLEQGSSEGHENILQPFFKLVRHAVKSARAGDGTEFLPRLTTLRLLGDPIDHVNLFDLAICKPLLQLQSLEKIITYRDNGKWSAFVDGKSVASKQAQAFNNIRVAEFQQNPCLDHDIRALGILLANLEVLKISNRFIGSNANGLWRPIWDNRSLGDPKESLERALGKMKNLRTLILDLQYGAENFGGMIAPKNPDLASLPKLETLKIPLAMLVMEHRMSDRDRIGRLQDVLPKSLRHLTLSVEVDCPNCEEAEGGPCLPQDPTWPPTSKIGVLVFMETLSKLGQKAFPDLREICGKFRADFDEEDLDGFSEIDDDYDSQRFALVQSSFHQQNMHISVVYEDIDCSCGFMTSGPRDY